MQQPGQVLVLDQDLARRARLSEPLPIDQELVARRDEPVRAGHRWELAALLALFCILRLPFLLTIPWTHAPDEPQHLWIVRYISQHFYSPSLGELFDSGQQSWYGAFPPFGYYVAALLAWVLHGVVPFLLAARLGSIIVGLPMVWATYEVGKEVFAKRLIAGCLSLLVIAHPQLVFTQSYCNSDGTLISLSAIAMLIMIRCLKYGANCKNVLLLGCTVGGAALAKTNGLALIPAFLWGLWKSCRNRRDSTFRFLQLSAVFAIGFGLVVSWPLLRNYGELHGDVLGTHTFSQLWTSSLPLVNGKPIVPWPPISKLSWWRYVWFDYWGLFGLMDMYLWRPLYLVFLAITILSSIGWSRLQLSFRKHVEENVSSTAKSEAHTYPSATGIWHFFLLSLILNLAATVYVTLSSVSGPHGRYLFPCEIPILCLTLAGLSRIGGRAERILCSILVAVCFVSTIGGWLYYFAGKSWRM